jgi:uncharacterized protein YfeS
MSCCIAEKRKIADLPKSVAFLNDINTSKYIWLAMFCFTIESDSKRQQLAYLSEYSTAQSDIIPITHETSFRGLKIFLHVTGTR